MSWEGINRRSSEVRKLPSVVYVMQPQSQMEEMGYNTLFYGWDLNHMVPTLIHPNEVLDGALVSGSFMPCSSKWSTYDLQNCPTIRRLYQEHGKTLNFLGVILSNLNVALEQKERAAQVVAQLATQLGADGAIVAEEGYGNPDTDFVACSWLWRMRVSKQWESPTNVPDGMGALSRWLRWIANWMRLFLPATSPS